MNELPSTSSGSKTEGDLNASNQNANMLLAENAERQRKQERRAERERYLQVRIRQREREMRLQNMQIIQLNGRRPPPAREIPLQDPYDSSESGYWSIKDRRPKTRTEQMWDRIRARERRLRIEKERQKKEEDKQELDAMFHLMLHDSDELIVSDGNEYEYKLPEFMKFDEIKRGFDEQMKRENAIKKEKEEAVRKAAAGNAKQKTKPTSSNFNNRWGRTINDYNFPPINTDWSMESNAPIKRKHTPFRSATSVVEVYASSDEEDNNNTAITKRAIEWTNSSTSTSASTSASGTSSKCTTASSAIITVHDSDSE